MILFHLEQGMSCNKPPYQLSSFSVDCIVTRKVLLKEFYTENMITDQDIPWCLYISLYIYTMIYTSERCYLAYCECIYENSGSHRLILTMFHVPHQCDNGVDLGKKPTDFI